MFLPQERTLLRELARRVAEIAALPVQEERRRRWRLHNGLRSREPMLLVFPEGSWRELLPPAALRCETQSARGVESELRRRIYYHEHFPDDTVVEARYPIRKSVTQSGWGLEPQRTPSTQQTGAWHYQPVLVEFSDLKKLRMPRIACDEEASRRKQADFQELFGDILEVPLLGVPRLDYHLIKQYADLRGLEQMFYDLAEEPRFVHDFLEFVTAAHQQILVQYQELNLLSLNNDNTYQNSGGNGWSDELPAPGFDPARVRPCDQWGCSESQEFTAVSPAMHREFALAYEERLLKPFGLTGYGCCEDLAGKLPDVLRLPGMRRVSISPFADVVRSAEQLEDRFIFSWKPNPAMLVGAFNEEGIRAYIRRTLEVAEGCVLEIILKDTHTVEDQPWRMDRWLRIAREEIESRAGALA